MTFEFSKRADIPTLATGNVVRPIARTERWIEKQTGRALLEDEMIMNTFQNGCKLF
jgi:hypothetical protein